MEKPTGQKKYLLELYRENIFDMRSKGYSYRQIVEFLESKGVIVSLNTIRNFLFRTNN